MNDNFKIVFLTEYLLSLAERTRVEKNTIKYGFDWVIYNIAIAKNWIPVRLPFFRSSHASTAKTKTEAEFGIDMSFFSNKKELIIFVLKDEALNRKNWVSHNFDSDLRMASAPNLSSKEYKSVKKVKIVLAFNKDEDNTGIKLFENLTNNLPSKMGDNRTLTFERWNLSRLVQEVEANLLSPALMPQHLSSLFTYITSQIADFDYGAKEWEEQLLPNWKNFLKLALREPLDERKLRLIPVALLVLYHYRKPDPKSYSGWIDLIEWAILSLWNCYQNLNNKKLKAIIFEIWAQFYIGELDRYLTEVSHVFTTEHGFHTNKPAFGLRPIIDSHIIHWHIARLGILTLAAQEIINTNKEEGKELVFKIVNRNVEWLRGCLRLNPGALRPLLDINHIELFLIWLIFMQAGRKDEIYDWLSELESRLMVRRIGKVQVPFIESRSRMDLVAEFAATGIRPAEFTDSSSYLLLMLLELCFSLENERRDELLNKYFRRIVKGMGDDGKTIVDHQIDLIGWVPPDDWNNTILKQQVVNGTAIATNNFELLEQEKRPFSERIKSYVELSRNKFPHEIPRNVPASVLILACLKHKSPLPTEFWRELIFLENRTENK